MKANMRCNCSLGTQLFGEIGNIKKEMALISLQMASWLQLHLGVFFLLLF